MMSNRVRQLVGIVLLMILAACSTGAPPPSPSSFEAVPSAYGAVLSWAAVSGASSYVLERKTGEADSSEPFAQVYSGSDTGYSDSLSPNTTYTYRLKAKAGALESAGVLKTLKTPQATLANPQGFSANATSPTSVSLSWTGVSGASSYVLERKTGDPDGPEAFSLVQNNLSETGYTDTVSPNTSYTYRLKAKNGTLESSGVVASVTSPALSDPANFEATPTSPTSISLSWSAVSGASSYVLERKTGEASSANPYTLLQSGSQTSYTDTVSTNTTYTYRLKAKSDTAESSGALKSVTTSDTPPPDPATFTATATSATSISLSWSAVANASGYVLERKTGDINSNAIYSQIATPSSTSYTEAASPNTTYTYRLKAKNAVGISEGVVKSVTTPNTPPANPGSFSATASSPTSVALSWSAASGATTYVLERGSGANPGSFSQVYSGTGLSYSDNVAFNTTYTYRLKARNSAGDSSGVTKTLTTPNAPPASPTFATPVLLAVSNVSSPVKLSWTPSASGGIPTRYYVERGFPGNGASYAQIYSGSATTLTDETANFETTYSYSIRASNEAGFSPWVTVTVVTLAPPWPDLPGNFAASAQAYNQIKLTWTAPTSGGPVREYVIERKTGSGGSYSQIAVVTAPASSYTSSGLSGNTTYTYRLKARNAGGSSSTVEASATTTTPPPPGMPGDFRVSDIRSYRIDLAWTAAESAESYTLERKTASDPDFSPLATVYSTSYSDFSVVPSTAYTYRLVANNPGGTSAPLTLSVSTPTPPVRVLFIGNSHTYNHDVPEMVRQIALAAGDPRQIEYDTVIQFGETLEYHWNAGIAQSKINQGGWDVVVLQEFSTRPIEEPAKYYDYVHRFIGLIKGVGAKPLLFLNWRRTDYPNPQSDWNSVIFSAADTDSVAVAPIGMAWANTSGVNLYEDGNHATTEGAYLASATIYASIYGHAALPINNGLDSSLQSSLAATAWLVVAGLSAQYRLP